MKNKLLLHFMGKFLMALIIAILLHLQTFAQTPLVVSGTIVDSTNAEPIIGASIIVAGTNNGTQSDVKGHFSLQANKGATLLIRYIGYTEKRILVGNNAP